MNLINTTPINAQPFLLMDRIGAETLLLVLKGTWSIGVNGKLAVSEDQVPIHLSPLYRGAPGSSSLAYDSDIVLSKPGTDCALIGHAWAPNSRSTQVDVIFSVGPICHKARVFGERRWIKHGWNAPTISAGAPFEKIALTWEHAFGGADCSAQDPTNHAFCLENPVGRGMMSRRSNLYLDALLLPNIENPADLISKPGQSPKPTGFGMIAPYWQPRASYAGTYDENWRRNVSPLPPADLDPRFYSSSPPGLCTPTHLTGTEQVMVEGATQEGTLCFELPAAKPLAYIRHGRNEEVVGLQLDTLIVEPDVARVVLVWRGIMNVHGKVRRLRTLRVEM
jgi:hypothetical protein